MANSATTSTPNTNNQPGADGNGDGEQQGREYKFKGPGSRSMNAAWDKALERHPGDEAMATAAFESCLADVMADATDRQRKLVDAREDSPWHLPEEADEEKGEEQRKAPAGLVVYKETPAVLQRLLDADDYQANSLLRRNRSGEVTGIWYGHCRRCNMPLQPSDGVFIVGRMTKELEILMKAVQKVFEQEQKGKAERKAWEGSTEAKMAMVDALVEGFGDLVIALRPGYMNNRDGKPDAVRAYHLVAGNIMLCPKVHKAGGEGKERYGASPEVQVKRTGDPLEDFKRVSCGTYSKASGWIVVDFATMMYIAKKNHTVRLALKDGTDHLKLERRKDETAAHILAAERAHNEAVGKPMVIDMRKDQRGGKEVLTPVPAGVLTPERRDRALRSRFATMDVRLILDTEAEETPARQGPKPSTPAGNK